MIPPSPRPTQILLVDDKAKVRESLPARIRAELPQARVKSVHSGEEAVALLAAEDYDIVLCDLALKGELDGVDVTRRAQEITPHTRVVIFTGREVDRKEDALQAGAFSYLGKPVDHNELLHTIDIINKIRRTEQLGEGFEALTKISSELQASFEFSHVARKIVEGACTLLGYRRARLYLYEPAEKVLFGRAAWGNHEGLQFQGYPIPVGARAVVQEVFEREKPILCDRKALEKIFGSDAVEPWATELRLREISWIDCPLRIENRRIGTLALDRLGDEKVEYTEDDLEIAALLAGLAAQALTNSRAYESEALANASLKSILRDAPDAIVTTDLRGFITFASPSAEVVTGFTSKEMVGMRVQSFYTDAVGSSRAGQEIAWSVMAYLKKTGRIDNRLFLVRHRDGSARRMAISASLLRGADDKEIGTLGFLKDLSPFEGQSQKYRDLLEGFGYGSVLLSAKGKVEFINPKAKRLLHAAAQNLEGGQFTDLVHTAHRETFEAAQKKVADGTEAEVSVDFSAVRPDGTRVSLRARLSAIHRGTKVTGIAVALYDKGELDALIQSGRLMALGQIVAGVAHEIKNPLNNITTNLTVLREELDDAGLFYGENIDTFNRVLSNSRRVNQIVDRMKGFARSGEFQPEALSLHQVVRDAVGFFDRRLHHQNIAIRMQVPEDLPHIHGDRTGLMQIFVALIVNAEEAMETTTREKTISIEAAAAGDWVTVCVRDTGPGIPAAIRDAIFDPFFTTKMAGKGTGLGLSICRQILEMIGGSIQVEDGGEAWGACFRVTIPVTSQSDT